MISCQWLIEQDPVKTRVIKDLRRRDSAPTAPSGDPSVAKQRIWELTQLLQGSRKALENETRRAEQYKAKYDKTRGALEDTSARLNESLSNAHHWFVRTQELDAGLRDLYKSRSWRFTRPLRTLLGSLYRIRGALWVTRTSGIERHGQGSRSAKVENRHAGDQLSNLTPWAREVYGKLQQAIEDVGGRDAHRD